jgi:hypothetical protein
MLSAWCLVPGNSLGDGISLQPSHAATTTGIILYKVGMTISPFIGTLDNAIKAIMIQLALKASILGLRKVTRQDCFDKQILFVHAKALTIGAPGHNAPIIFSFYVHEHFMKFDGKCHVAT